MTEQDIAHRAAAERGDGADEAQTEAIHAATHAHERAGHGFRDDREQVEEMEQHDGEPLERRSRTAPAWSALARRALKSGHYRKRAVSMKMP
ncbi:hypothetical protein [Paraburkholderia phytofirmans]|uniref:hypothetical protein n=1 Tax=Paraburkholderia phytofirmans TaxID=261302 RepID=UPI001EE6445E|nr:hypothetical protein [Paraburkholderia phytofirmans]